MAKDKKNIGLILKWVFGIISAKNKIIKVNAIDANNTKLLSLSNTIWAWTPIAVAPSVFANVFRINIDDIDLSMSVFNSLKSLPAFGLLFSSTEIYVTFTDNSIDSSIEQRNEIVITSTNKNIKYSIIPA